MSYLPDWCTGAPEAEEEHLQQPEAAAPPVKRSRLAIESASSPPTRTATAEAEALVVEAVGQPDVGVDMEPSPQQEGAEVVAEPQQVRLLSTTASTIYWWCVGMQTFGRNICHPNESDVCVVMARTYLCHSNRASSL